MNLLGILALAVLTAAGAPFAYAEGVDGQDLPGENAPGILHYQDGPTDVYAGQADSPEEAIEAAKKLREEIIANEARNGRASGGEPKILIDSADPKSETAKFAEQVFPGKGRESISEQEHIAEAFTRFDSYMDARRAQARIESLKFLTDRPSGAYRIGFALVRAVGSGGVATWGLIVRTGMSITHALPLGIVMGTMSFILQYNAEFFGNWLIKTGFLERHFKIKNEKIKSASHASEEFSKWYSAEVVFLAAAEMTVDVITGSGLGKAFSTDAIRTILVTAAMSVAAQAPADIGVARIARMSLEDASGDLELRRKIRIKRDLKNLSVSLLSVGSAVAQLLHLSIAPVGFITVGVVGARFYFKAKRMSAARAKALADESSCENLLVGNAA